MKSASPTDRPLTRANRRAAIRARHRRTAISAAASAVVCGQQAPSCTLTTPNCRPKNHNRFHHRNQQYSIITLTDGSGAIEERYVYSAYGEPVFVNATGTVLSDSAKDNRYTYTGREWDEELSLYHFRARMYDAESGRFCGRDPIAFEGGLSLVAFGLSNPIKYYDPTGLKPKVGDKTEICSCMPLPQHWFGCCKHPTEKNSFGGSVYTVFKRSESCCSSNGQIYSDRTTNAQCCADAKAAGIDLGNGGGVICCHGRKVACSWEEPSGDTEADEYIRECILLHERSHFDVTTCGRKECLSRPYPNRGTNIIREECEGYRIEWSCLRRKLSQCSTVRCEEEIRDMMNFKLLKAWENYGCIISYSH